MSLHRSTRALHLRGIAALLASSFHFGCSDSDESGCQGRLPACDIRNASCQRDVFEETACVRDQPDEAIPAVRTLTIEEVEEELRALLIDGSSTDADPWGPGLGQLELVDATQTLDESVIDAIVSSVAAYYDPSTGDITIIDTGEAARPEDDPWILSHELVHALQDRAVDLPSFRDRWVDSTDSDAAIDCLVEGEAMVLSTVLLLPNVGSSAPAYDWRAFGNRIIDELLADTSSSDSPLLDAALGLSYGIGSAELGEAYVAGGLGAITSQYDQPRTSLLEWLEDAPPASLDCYPTDPPQGFAGYDHDSLGVTGLIALWIALGSDPVTAFTEARGWRQDSLVLFVDETNGTEVAVAWRIRMDSTASAGRLASLAAKELSGPLIVETENLDVIIRTAASVDVLGTWLGPGCGTAADLPAEAPSESDLQAARHRGLLPPLHFAPRRAPRM